MTRKIWIVLVSLWMASPEMSMAASSTVVGVERKGKRTKSGRYKKKMGLFGRKKDCGCPKH